MNPDTKLDTMRFGAAWGGVGLAKALEAIGVQSWSDAAALAAFCLTCLMIVDWFWKRFFRKTKDHE